MTGLGQRRRSGRRRWIGWSPAAGAIGCVLATVCPVHAEDPLTGAAAWSRVVGNTVTGSTPDGPYSEIFRADGSLTIVDNDGKGAGHWTLRDDRLCTQVDDDEEECRSLAVSGQSGSFTDEAGSRYAFDIVEGNPKGL